MKQNYIAPQTKVVRIFTVRLLSASPSSLSIKGSEAATEGDDGIVLSRRHDNTWTYEEVDE